MNNALLIYSSTKKDADLRYLLGTNVPDDIAVIYSPNGITALVSALEIGRLKKISKDITLIPWEEIKSQVPVEARSDAAIIAKFLEKIGLKSFSVKGNFPIYIGDQLRQYGFLLSVTEQTLLPQRLVKKQFEIDEICHCATIVSNVFQEVVTILSEATIGKNNMLIWKGEPLTSEKLRNVMEDSCYQLGAIADDTIIACGKDACDPHNIGHGPIRANEFIVFDFFPYLKSSGYYADVSRTFLKGHPTAGQAKMYNAVKKAHDIGIKMAKNQAQVRNIMQAVLDSFEKDGYPTDKLATPPHGMIHSLGHGLGLDIHEPPRLGLCNDILTSGMAVTIEPGLYYPNIGGIRIEDDILIEKNSAKILSHIPYDWVIE